MKRVLITCVNYDTYDHLLRFVDSINSSLQDFSSLDLQVSVYIADNSRRKVEVDLSSFSRIDIKLFKFDNLGYLGGASAIINSVEKISYFDFVIISNVDLVIDNTFFSNLTASDLADNIGWVTPSIYSEFEKRDKNPRVLKRYSYFRMRLFQLMYRYPILNKIYYVTLYKRKKILSQPKSIKEIYAGHGSFIILTKCFFSTYEKINYPVFLYGEEIFLAEMIRNGEMRVIYLPELKVYDLEHASTGLMKRSSYYHYNYEAISFLLKRFYR